MKLSKSVFYDSHKNLFFGVISYNLLHFIALKKCKKESTMLEIILVQGFRALESKITQFLNGFRLKGFFPMYLFNL